MEAGDSMIKKIINLIVIFAVIIGISGIFIHLYNNSNRKNLNHKSNNIKEEAKEKKKSTKNNNESKNNKSKNNTKNEENNKEVELDDNDIADNDNDDNTEEVTDSTDKNISGSEINVGSTGTKENIYISIIGGIIIISGIGVITLKLNKNRV